MCTFLWPSQNIWTLTYSTVLIVGTNSFYAGSTYSSLRNRCVFKALHLFFLPNFPGPTFIPCPRFIPEARVGLNTKKNILWRTYDLIVQIIVTLVERKLDKQFKCFKVPWLWKYVSIFTFTINVKNIFFRAILQCCCDKCS